MFFLSESAGSCGIWCIVVAFAYGFALSGYIQCVCHLRCDLQGKLDDIACQMEVKWTDGALLSAFSGGVRVL